ncbi:hypothetical protein [Bdellovibrio reynosensis]|uniref:Lipoprotein n=1 Tax=Bdellovibrio reynosensis TaxID=2835041 RepID=A0ABY4CAG6_9BACT|nr:hypothetical protein [Bdellovibrio reynosensis]UOF00887.1 hypothetical protein MNR06_14390 [Bdellovibrio reynosensis]
MKKLFVSLMAIYSAFLVTGCDKGGGGGTNVVQVPVCAAGSVWNGTSCVVGVNGSASTAFRYKVSSYSRGDSSGIRNFLEYGLDVCRENNSTGYYDCGNWGANNFQINIAGNINNSNYCAPKQVTPAQVTVNIAIQAPLNMYVNYGTLFGTWPTYRYNGANMTGVGSNISDCNSASIEVQYGLGRLTLQIVNSNLNQTTVPFKLWWAHTSDPTQRLIGSGNLVRY